MKKIILGGLMVFAITTINAQTNTATKDQIKTNQNNQIKVPSQVMDKFKTDHPNMDVSWGRDGDNYTATYKDQSSQSGRMLTYDRNGMLLYTDTEMDGSGYPTGIDDYYGKNYPNEKYTVWSSDDGKGDITYYTKRKDGKRNWFDKDGKYSPSRPISDMQDTKSSKANKDTDKDKNNNNIKGTR